MASTTAVTTPELTCCSTINAFALLSLDALCCIPCCMGCGGCFGKYDSCISSAIDDTKTKPGQERMGSVCMLQCMAAMFLPFTCCGCCWACCGTCVPCATGVLNLAKNNNRVVDNVKPVTKPPADQTFERELNNFTRDFLNNK